MPFPPMECDRCGRKFQYKVGKIYCGRQCSDEARNARLSTAGSAWENLPIFQVAAEKEHLLTSLRWAPGQNRTECIVREHAPELADHFRLGSSNPFDKTGFPLVHWFPTAATHRPAAFRLNPYQLPNVPFPGDYIIAYFDEGGQLVEPPRGRVHVDIPVPRVTWSAGDKRLLLDARK